MFNSYKNDELYLSSVFVTIAYIILFPTSVISLRIIHIEVAILGGLSFTFRIVILE